MANALDTYLKSRNLGDADFGQVIGRDRSYVSKLRRGLVTPSLELAGVIERLSMGEVPMQSWLADESEAA